MKRLMQYIGLFVLIVAIQVLILNNVNVNGFGTPLVYVGLIIALPYALNRSVKLLVGFLLGAVIDLSVGCAGVHAAATTAASMAYVLSADFFMPNEDKRLYALMTPSPMSMGWGQFVRFALVVVLVHHTVLYAVEAMSLAHVLFLIIRIVLSGVTTMALILVTEYYISRR